MDELGLGTLDYVYAPSSDVAADARWFSEILGAECVFVIDSDGTRVAMLRAAQIGGAPASRATVVPPSCSRRSNRHER